VADPEIDIVVELVGVLPTARQIALASIKAHKHLVTANKQLVRSTAPNSRNGVELPGELGHRGLRSRGTPLLHAIREGLAGENFHAVYGILNGTTNYILTEMEARGCAFSAALAEAQQKGYAEPDPTLTSRATMPGTRSLILAMMCFGRSVRVEQIPVRRDHAHRPS